MWVNFPFIHKNVDNISPWVGTRVRLTSAMCSAEVFDLDLCHLGSPRFDHRYKILSDSTTEKHGKTWVYIFNSCLSGI